MIYFTDFIMTVFIMYLTIVVCRIVVYNQLKDEQGKEEERMAIWARLIASGDLKITMREPILEQPILEPPLDNEVDGQPIPEGE